MSVRGVPKLILVEPSGVRREVPLAHTPLTIGRQPDSALPLPDHRMSRQHAVIRAEKGRYLIEDCQSRQGTFVNGERVEGHRELRNKDRIEFGIPDSYTLIFVSEEESLRALLNRVDTPASPQATSQELSKLGLVLEVGRALHAGLALEDLLKIVVDACLNVTGTERGSIWLRNEQGQLEFWGGRDRNQHSLTQDDLGVSHAVIRQAVEHARDIVVTDTKAPARGVLPDGVAKPELRTVICLPLPRLPPAGSMASTVVGTVSDVLGILYLDGRQLPQPISKTDRKVLRSLALEAASVVEDARLFTAAHAKERLDQELAIAHSIQQGLLPQSPKRYDFFQIACLTIPCYEVGGDYYDLIELPDHHFAFVVADVSGKGISAALLSSNIQGALAAGLQGGQSVPAVVRHLNAYLCQHTEASKFATFFCGVLSPQGAFQYVNAGHSPALWLTRDGIETLPSENLPLGLFEQDEYAAPEIQLRPHDVLVLYTDGVVEACNPLGEFYGLEQLKNVLTVGRGKSPEELTEAVLGDLRKFTQNTLLEDDVTVVVVCYEGNV
jgi:serine phosphatase RsbU (regulator of sigma subunit)/pSer/pThr/pTyr-binding forkhead associated (FHA) protein